MNMGYIYVILCYALVGVSYPIAADAMNSIPPWTFTFITFLIGAVILLPIAKTVDKTKFTAIPAKSWAAIAVQALLGAVLYTAFLLFSFEYATVITSSIFSSLAPAVVLILAALLLGEAISARKLLAIALAVAGVLVLTLPGAESSGTTSVLGYVFLVLSTLSTAGCVIAAKKLEVHLPAITMATGVCITGTLFSLVPALTEMGDFSVSALTSSDWLVLVYYGALVWAAPYVCFYKGVTKIPASATGMAFAVIPLAATFLSILFFGESLTMNAGLALGMVLVSILLAESRHEVEEMSNEDVSLAKIS